MQTHKHPVTALVICLLFAGAAAFAAEPVDFNQDIRPLLSNNCFHCHGPDEEDRQADLRLDQPSDFDFNEVVARITETDPDLVMPPPGSHKKLSPEQIATLTAWIEQGAPYAEHWAFVPPQPRAVPTPQNSQWSEQAIDRFVMAQWDKAGVRANYLADKRTLIRRLTLDLTGLPPTMEEINDFLADESDEAYANLVDRLLSSPHYGEHMARYWLDLVRFADTNGLHHDHYRDMTPYRDWTIRAFNTNLAFDEFVRHQVAGDLYADPTTDQLIASGFNRLHLIIDVGTALPEESFNRNVVDRVSAVGTAFLGLTLQCAVCHDHKYDPITQKDFYQLYAFFNNFDGEPETGRRSGLAFKRGLQEPYIELPSPAQSAQLKQLDQEIAELTSEAETLKKQRKAESLEVKSVASGEENQSNAMEDLQAKIKAKQQQRAELLMQVPAAMVMRERQEVRPAHVLIRGGYDTPGELVQRNTPSFLPALKSGDEVPSRMDLADWLVDSNNPLTARVAVNRIWQQFFGVGLVKTSEDFGAQGQAPSHPELLDHLTLSFVGSGWDVKALVRSIVMSKTYQQSSKTTPNAYATDPANRLLARGSRFRLDAEVIRDQLLAVSGLLNPTMYGRSVKPPQPDGLWETVTMPSSYPRRYRTDSGSEVYRRGVYSFWKRALPPPQMTIFDAPTRESCIARRERTNTPLQALLLMNEQQYFAAASHHAANLLSQQELSDLQRIQLAYEQVTSQLPSDNTLQQLSAALEAFRQTYANDPALAKAVIAGSSPSQGEAELAAWTMIVHSLYNLDAPRHRE